jgi:DNA-binding protein YbaB
MTTAVSMQEKIRKMEDELKRLQAELEKMRRKGSQFERIDTDVYLTEVYNG